MSSTLAKLISDFYKIKDSPMNLDKYNKLLILYANIRNTSEKYVNMSEWNNYYIRNKNTIPESPPTKSMINKTIQDMLNINYLELILKLYKILDSTTNLKQIPENVIKELQFINFILSKQGNISFKIHNNTWKDVRNKCLIGRNKTKMPRNSITLGEIIYQINSVISLN